MWARERFGYEYSDQELKEWVSMHPDRLAEARETHVVMNNCYADFAVRNARSSRTCWRNGLVRTRVRPDPAGTPAWKGG